MGVSENSVPLNPMVLLIIIPMKNGYNMGNIPNIFRQTHMEVFQIHGGYKSSSRRRGNIRPSALFAKSWPIIERDRIFKSTDPTLW